MGPKVQRLKAAKTPVSAKLCILNLWKI